MLPEFSGHTEARRELFISPERSDYSVLLNVCFVRHEFVSLVFENCQRSCPLSLRCLPRLFEFPPEAC